MLIATGPRCRARKCATPTSSREFSVTDVEPGGCGRLEGEQGRTPSNATIRGVNAEHQRDPETITQTIQLAIRATPEQVWHALTDGSVTPAYYLGFEAHYDDLTPSAPYSYTAGGGDMITGSIIEADTGRHLKTTFNGHWDPSVADPPESVVTFSVFEPFMPMACVTFLSCVHENLPATETARHLEIGWVSILSGLKTLLETGRPLANPPAPAA